MSLPIVDAEGYEVCPGCCHVFEVGSMMGLKELRIQWLIG